MSALPPKPGIDCVLWDEVQRFFSASSRNWSGTDRDSPSITDPQRLEWDFENRIDDDELDAALSGSPEVLADRFGVRTALLVLCIALFIAAIWLTSRPSFEKCSGLE